MIRIKSFRISNLKSLGDTGEVELRPLTFLVGPNSAGKSSVLDAFLVVRQTVDSRDVERSIVLDGNYVQLGPYRDFIHLHEEDRMLTLSFTLECDSFPWQVLRLVSKSGARGPVIVAFESKLGASTPQMLVHTKETRYSVFDEQLKKLLEIRKERGPRGKVSATASFAHTTTDKYTPARKAKFYDVTFSPRFRGSRSTGASWFYLGRLTSWLVSEFENVFSRLFYIGPIREEPSRLYVATGERPQDVGRSGEFTMPVLFLGRREKRLAEIRRQLTRWMKEFQIASAVDLRQIEAPYFYLEMTDPYTNTTVNLADVGFGASQILPLIVEGYYSPPYSTIIAEQPEIHLHPKAQGTLADLLIDVAKTRRSLVIETHSEHMLARIQRRVAEQAIKSSDVAIYYCRPTQAGTRLERIYLNEYGQFEPQGLPSDFFSEGYAESKAMAEAITKRVNSNGK